MATSKDKKKITKVPENSLMFDLGENSVSFKDNGEDKPPTIKMVGYSGGIIPKHWYWGNLAIDISGMSFPKDKYPILKEHDTSRIIAFTKKPKTENNQLTVEEAVYMPTEYADEFINLSKQGFPFQASIRIDPKSIERVGENQEVQVNGYTFKGPGTVMRKTVFKEVSVCVFGYDGETSAAAFSKDAKEVELSLEEVNINAVEEDNMDASMFKEKHPEEYKKIVDEVSASFSAQVAEKDKQITELSKNGAESENRLKSLERAVEMFKEVNIKNEALSILNSKLSASGLPERTFSKIRVDYNPFVKDNVLDVTAYSAAIEAEVGEWKTMFSTTTPSTVIGGGASPAPAGSNGSATSFSKEDADKAAEEILRQQGLIK